MLGSEHEHLQSVQYPYMPRFRELDTARDPLPPGAALVEVEVLQLDPTTL